MEQVVETIDRKSTGTHRRRSEADLDVERLGAAPSLDWSDELARLSPSERKDVFEMAGKGIARDLGADLVAEMLAKTKLSQREIDAQTGFDHSALSRMAQGQTKQGPSLWKLYALAEALGFELELKLTSK